MTRHFSATFYFTVWWRQVKKKVKENMQVTLKLLKSLTLWSSIHRKLVSTSLSVYVDLFWTASGEKWMCAINKSSGWGPTPAWLLVNGTLLWRQITHWLGFQWKGIQLEYINIAVGNTTNHVILKRQTFCGREPGFTPKRLSYQNC